MKNYNEYVVYFPFIHDEEEYIWQETTRKNFENWMEHARRIAKREDMEFVITGWPGEDGPLILYKLNGRTVGTIYLDWYKGKKYPTAKERSAYGYIN